MLTTLAEVTFGAFVDQWRDSKDKLTIAEAIRKEHPTTQQVLIGQMIDAMLELADFKSSEIDKRNESAVGFCRKMRDRTTPQERAMPYC